MLSILLHKSLPMKLLVFECQKMYYRRNYRRKYKTKGFTVTRKFTVSYYNQTGLYARGSVLYTTYSEYKLDDLQNHQSLKSINLKMRYIMKKLKIYLCYC